MIGASKRIGLLGGTFDPIHSGHLILASQAAESLDLEQILFIPAKIPPHKLGETITPAADRVAMVEAAIDHDDRFVFSDFDLRTNEPSFTADLVTRISNNMPEYELYFITGADSLRDFPTWHKPQEILEHVFLAVAGRPGVDITAEMLDSVPMLRRRIRLFNSPLIDISSTSIRHRVRAGRCIRYLVPEDVRELIVERNLYRDTEG